MNNTIENAKEYMRKNRLNGGMFSSTENLAQGFVEYASAVQEKEERTCGNCKYENVGGFDYPCIACNNDFWEPKEKEENQLKPISLHEAYNKLREEKELLILTKDELDKWESVEEMAEELWDKYSEDISNDIDELADIAGKTFMSHEEFFNCIHHSFMPKITREEYIKFALYFWSHELGKTATRDGAERILNEYLLIDESNSQII